MTAGKTDSRVLVYSHDTFGLGHLRRCRTIAHALVGNFKGMSVLIVSGSPIIGSFDYRARVDFVRVPGVVKLRNGEYTPLNLHLNIDEMLRLRGSIIRHTAESFEPDLMLVDKEPLGLRGEIADCLAPLKAKNCRLVLGLRDILDDPERLAREWQRKAVLPALENLDDEIWIYGLPQIHEPLKDLGLPRAVLDKVVYTGYLPRTVPSALDTTPRPEITRQPYILVTPGGGGDGELLVDWVLRAYESDSGLPHPALLVLGPFMQLEQRNAFAARVARLENVDSIVFDANIEQLEENAVAMVTMGGYNTFCEILSLDKRALMVPRTEPRREQLIRAERARDLGLASMLLPSQKDDASVMADALRALAGQPRPSEVVIPGLLDGLVNLNRLAEPWLSQARVRPADNVTSLEEARRARDSSRAP